VQGNGAEARGLVASNRETRMRAGTGIAGIAGRLAAGIAGLAFAAAAIAAADEPAPAWKHDVAAARATFERDTGLPLRPGFRIEATVFPRYYALRSDAPGRPSAYFRDDMKWTANVRSPGWSTSDKAEGSAEGQARWHRELVRALPLDRLVKVKRRTPYVAVIWSAPDCPFCRRLERSLEEAGASVYLVPVGLSEDGFRRSAQAYCATDPAAAWRAAMGEGPVAAGGPAREGCRYPRDTMVDIGFFVGRGRLATPIVVFADGSSITGWDDERGPARLRQIIAGGPAFPER
jgi:protein disulfide-isomerase